MNFTGPFSDFPVKITPPRIILTGYISVILLGTFLLSLPIATQTGDPASILEALFTATSAVCVTGLIVVNTAAYWSIFGQITILVLIQIGGLGFMTLSTLAFILIGKKITFSERALIKQDLGHLSYSGLVKLVRYVIGLTLFIEVIGTLLLFLNFSQQMETLKAFWFSLFHTVSAFNNAGFDIFGNSLEGYTTDFSVNIIFTALIIIGGLGFTVTGDLVRNIGRKNKFKMLSLHSKMVIAITIVLLIVGTIVVLGFEYNNTATIQELNISEKVMASFFLSVTPRTAGFNTVPTGELGINTLFFVIILMFIGASPCSTGGGIKTTTFGVLLYFVVSAIRGERNVSLFNRRLSYDVVNRAVSIIFISLTLIILTTIILTITEDALFIDILFETVSAFGTVGLSTGITGDLSSLGRIAVIVTMLAGRVGPLTLVVSLGELEPKTKGLRYPKEDVMIG